MRILPLRRVPRKPQKTPVFLEIEREEQLPAAAFRAVCMGVLALNTPTLIPNT